MHLSALVSTNGERLLGGHTGRMLGVLSSGLTTAKMSRFVLPPLLPAIIVDLSITPFQAGIALSLAPLGMALFLFPSGRLSDQLTRKTVLLAGLSAIIAGSLLLSVTISYPLLLVGAAIVGIGEGTYGAADRGLLSDLFVEKRGAAFGIHLTFFDLAGVLAAGLAVAALGYGVWQNAFLPIAASAVVVAILLYRWSTDPIVLDRPPLRIGETFRRLFFQSRFRWMLVAYSLVAFTSHGVIGFLPSLLQVDHGYSATLASTAFAIMFATGIVTRPLAGRLSDFRNRLVVAGTSLIVGAIGIVGLVTLSAPLFIFASIFVFAAGQKAFPPTMQAYLMDAFPTESMAGDLGATRTFYIGVGSLGPTYVGFVASHLSYTAAFAGFVLTLLIAGAIALGLLVTGPSQSGGR